GHVFGAEEAGRLTNQRAAQTALSAQTEPNRLAARQISDSQSVANVPICSRAILHMSPGLRLRLRIEITTLRQYDVTTPSRASAPAAGLSARKRPALPRD